MTSDMTVPKVLNSANGSDAVATPLPDDAMLLIEQALADRAMRGVGPLARALEAIFQRRVPRRS